MAINKVVLNKKDGEEVLIDLTDDSVTPETLAKGVTAHDAAGNQIVGTGSVGDFSTDETLKFENDTLSVNTIDTVKEGSKLPITSGAVFTTVGNIEVLMKTI